MLAVAWRFRVWWKGLPTHHPEWERHVVVGSTPQLLGWAFLGLLIIRRTYHQRGMSEIAGIPHHTPGIPDDADALLRLLVCTLNPFCVHDEDPVTSEITFPTRASSAYASSAWRRSSSAYCFVRGSRSEKCTEQEQP